MLSDLLINIAASAIWFIGGLIIGFFVRVFQLDSRLAGRWEGTLSCGDSGRPELSTHVFYITMILAKPTRGASSGVLCYQRECTESNEILRRGVDELSKYHRGKDSRWRSPRVILEFTRRFHLKINGDVDYSTASRSFECTMIEILSVSPTIEVTTTIPETGGRSSLWTGRLSKR